MSHRAWTQVSLVFAILSGLTAPYAAISAHAPAGVTGAVSCTFWTAIWLRRKAREDADPSLTASTVKPGGFDR
jgi:hypothetical protein